MFSKNIRQVIIYFLVGSGATVVEWSFFYFFNVILVMHYAISTTLAFVASTFANWFFGRIALFRKGDSKGLFHEIASIYIVSIVGLLLNLLIMWIAIEKFQVPDMAAKIISTAIVFAGNFIVRKLYIYKI